MFSCLIVCTLLITILCLVLSHVMRLRINSSKFALLLRFGTVSAVDGLDSSKNSEDLKRKARAERFLPFHSMCLCVDFVVAAAVK